ncbi:transposase, partial [Nocardia amikacinitolerans]|uniref:transposase n=1 Tax=Nocardia amikacinitolerans TaxID=756689 RepID=UPI0040393452
AVTRSFWDLVVGSGVSASAAGLAVGASATSGMRWFRDAGGVKPALGEPKTCGPRSRLTLSEREEITVGVAAEESIRSIARRLGRHPSTIMREIANNGGGRGRYRSTHRFGARRGGWEARPPYRASLAQARSETRARRPKPRKLALNDALRETVQDRLNAKHSPAQISGALRLEHRDR